MFETDMDAAIREFKEESGYTDKDFVIVTQTPLIEEFIGLNHNRYMCKYYIAVVNPEADLPAIDMNKPYQAGEISNIAWFTFPEAAKIIRPYSISKRNVLKTAYKLCKNLNFNLVELQFNSNNE